MLMRTRGVVQW
jgi:hypothetical protein